MTIRIWAFIFGFILFSHSAFADEVVSLDYYYYLMVAKRDIPFFCGYKEMDKRRTSRIYLEDIGDTLVGSFDTDALRGDAGPDIPSSRMTVTVTKDKATNNFRAFFEVFQSVEGEESPLMTMEIEDLDDINDITRSKSAYMDDERRHCSTGVNLHFVRSSPRR